MSESFSDLWASSNPVKSQQAQKSTLGAAVTAPTNVALRSAPDVFSMLASAGSRPDSRSITPTTRHTTVTSKYDTTADDAFGGLVSFGNSTSHDGGLTIAERVAKAERERKERTENDEVTFNIQGSFWDKFEDLPTGSFGFSDREDQVMGAIDSQDEDDILGSLAKPVEVGNGNGVNSKVPPLMSPSISSSPPPLGRIVEMGFSVQQAKGALAATLTGVDVDAALEILLQPSGSASPEERAGEAIETIEVESISGRRQGSSCATVPPAHSLSLHSSSSSTNQQGLQEQADKLLAQASMIGRTMFSKANAFWKESREQVGRVYQEHQEQRSGSGAEAGIGKGRPRWMDNSRLDEPENELLADESQDRQESIRIPIQPLFSIPDQRRSEYSISRFANDEPVYTSPARRRQPAKPSSPKPLSPSPISPPTTLPLIVRTCIDASPSALAASSTQKAEATEHFKLGRFAEAEVAYSRAIDALPTSHMLRIPLYNNRALTRLRTGEYKGTINDTTEVLYIITGALGTAAWNPGREEAGVRESCRNAVSKALRRRAEAYEGLEKWKDAAGDWEQLTAATWVALALKGDAIKGAGRCRQISRGGSSRTLSPKASSNSQPQPQSNLAPAHARPSEAVTRVRAANTALEKEDQARHDLKDVVDARLAAWRTGKENNLRALIASLDVVLSPTFCWQTVGMSELVTSGQVKVKYTKAISKLHPDKLNVNNTSLEERMIATSVFGTLNEAWNTFR